jgi:hypothetical protein
MIDYIGPVIGAGVLLLGIVGGIIITVWNIISDWRGQR